MRQFQNATKKLGEKNYDKNNEDRKFCKLFCGFADSLSDAQKRVPPEKKCPRRFTTFSQIKTYSFGPARNTCLHLRIISTHDFDINHFRI